MVAIGLVRNVDSYENPNEIHAIYIRIKSIISRYKQSVRLAQPE